MERECIHRRVGVANTYVQRFAITLRFRGNGLSCLPQGMKSSSGIKGGGRKDVVIASRPFG